MKFDRRDFLAASAANAMMPGCASAAASVLTPEQFGARGDGAANDTAAFQRLAAEVNRRGGGTISLRSGRTYVVGGQNLRKEAGGWFAEPILNLSGLHSALKILGNGARLRAQPGLRYGTFDVETGEPVHHPLPYVKRVDLAEAYGGMIWVRDCHEPVEIRDVELDGNVQQLRIGGKFGDAGWQIPAIGLRLQRNLGPEVVHNVYTHHHALDGAMFIGSPGRSGRGTITHFVARYNGRQGASVTAGHGYDFADCEFSHSARLAVKSAPAAGVDIEAESGRIRDLTFARCSFVDNGGCGLLADSGPSQVARFTDCRFIGTTNWSAWPKKPSFSFNGCTFVGAVVHPYPDADPGQAAHFVDCTFTDDPRLSPTGKVFVGPGPIVNLAESDNVLFDHCTFRCVAAGQLPWSWKAIYRDCLLSQTSSKGATPKGRFRGRTTISGPVDLNGSVVEGTLIVNGRPMPHGNIGDIHQKW
ncbi:MAG TPA: hypothetical protein VFU91_06850 [Sphingomicrobium sp.]|nr:hypothetical protein [Sphingomicrobium sp.]